MTTIREDSPTPWGPVQTWDNLGAGVYVVDTPGHGGLYVPPAILRNIPPKVRETALKEPGWPLGWAEEDCNLPVAMAFLYPYLDVDQVARTFPAQDRSGKEPLAFWQDAALQVAERYESLHACVPYLQSAKAQQKLPL